MTQNLSGRKMKKVAKPPKKLDEYVQTKPEQLTLFQLLTPGEKAYSNTVELYDFIPKYHWGKQERINGTLQHSLKREFECRGIRYKVRIDPARVEGKDGVDRDYFPGQREELVEDALRKLANDLAGFSISTTPWEFLATWLLDRTRVVAEFAYASTLTGQLRGIAIWQFLNFVRDQGPAMSSPPIRRVLDRVRQLVLLAEERDLRHVPAAALHIDAVRLLTIHGSKGLEFEAVHVPGLNVASLPSNWRHACSKVKFE